MSSYFYPRPPRGGRRTAYKYSCGSFPFLSTPSARRATRFRSWALASRSNFYPRPPRGGRHLLLQHQHPERQISIHALREEGDCSDTVHHRCCRYFYPRPPRGGRPSAAATVSITMPFLSTPSARRATPQWSLNRLFIFISIHALREEGDGLRLQGQTRPADFYPRPPRGGRPFNKRMRDEVGKFLSTPSARRATWRLRGMAPASKISIHALREEGDLSVSLCYTMTSRFLSTPSARRATPGTLPVTTPTPFLSTPSARRATLS